MKAFLFDIDGTLIQTSKLGRSPYAQSILEIFGIQVDLSHVEWMGRPDLDTLSELLGIYGISHNDFLSRWSDLKSLYIRYLRESLIENPSAIQAFPGVYNWLDTLQHQAIGIVTGNIKDAAYLKLKTAGLAKYFPKDTGGFGEEHTDRKILVQKALQKMQIYYQCSSFENVWVIGDSYRDILCAQSNNLNSLAVATGKQSIQELQSHQPTLILKNLESAPPQKLDEFKPKTWPQ